MSFHYLVDGFNLLYALPEMPSGTWEVKRRALLDLLHERQPQGRNRLTIVFDSRQGSGDRHTHHAIEVVYTASETADDWINRYVREMSNSRIAVVVTNDKGIHQLLRGTGAKILSNENFLREAPMPKKDESPRPPREELDDITDEFKKKWLL